MPLFFALGFIAMVLVRIWIEPIEDKDDERTAVDTPE